MVTVFQLDRSAEITFRAASSGEERLPTLMLESVGRDGEIRHARFVRR